LFSKILFCKCAKARVFRYGYSQSKTLVECSYLLQVARLHLLCEPSVVKINNCSDAPVNFGNWKRVTSAFENSPTMPNYTDFCKKKLNFVAQKGKKTF